MTQTPSMRKRSTTRQGRRDDFSKRRVDPKGGRFCRDVAGWWVPAPNTKMRQLYEMMKLGTPGAVMAEKLGWKKGTVHGMSNRIRKPTRIADHVRILVE